MRDKYVVVVDTNILLQSLLSGTGPAGKCLDYFRRGEIDISVSRDTLNEAKEVLSRSRLRIKYPQLTDEKVAHLTDFLLYRGTYLRSVKRRFEYPRDPQDEPFLNLAIEVEADYLISRDPDLLDLMKWEKEEGREFQKRFRFLKIVTPVEFLKAMESQDP
ncbi:MAG: putative toxin-antitoxin system toxin component, PIN family [Blastocatellia bacterium]